MIFSSKKIPVEREDSPYQVVRQLLQGCALHCVEFDTEQQAAFRSVIGNIADRFRWTADPQEWQTLTGEANNAVQA